jgi:hypothetical protein
MASLFYTTSGDGYQPMRDQLAQEDDGYCGIGTEAFQLRNRVRLAIQEPLQNGPCFCGKSLFLSIAGGHEFAGAVNAIP